MSVTKAIVAIVMSTLFLLNHFVGLDARVDEPVVTGAVEAVLALMTPVLVYLVPNRKRSKRCATRVAKTRRSGRSRKP